MVQDYLIGIHISEDGVLCSYRSGRHKGIMDRTGGYGQLLMPFDIGKASGSDQWLIGDEVNALDPSIDFIWRNLYSNQDEALIADYIIRAASYMYELNPKGHMVGLRIMGPFGWADRFGTLTSEVEKSLGCKVMIVTEGQAVAGGLKAIGSDLTKDWLVFDGQGLRHWQIRDGGSPSLIQTYESLGTSQVLDRLELQLRAAYENGAGIDVPREIEASIKQMAKSYLPVLYQRFIEKKKLRLTFTQSYPAFRASLPLETIGQVIGNSMEELAKGLVGITEKSKGQVLLSGNSVRYPWVRHMIRGSNLIDVHEAWEGLAFGLVEEEVEAKVLCIPKDIGIQIMDHGQVKYHTLAKAGTPLDAVNYTVDLLDLEKADCLCLYEKDKDKWCELISQPLPSDERKEPVIYRVSGYYDGTNRLRSAVEVLPI